MQFARLAIFVAAVVAGQVTGALIQRPADPTVGLMTDDEAVASYCNHQGNIPAGDYACFRLSGDIRQRMQSADDSVSGYVNTAGNTFVVMCDPDLDIEELEFHTDKTTVYISHPATSQCPIVTTVNVEEWTGQDGPGSKDYNACNTDSAVALAD